MRPLTAATALLVTGCALGLRASAVPIGVALTFGTLGPGLVLGLAMRPAGRGRTRAWPPIVAAYLLAGFALGGASAYTTAHDCRTRIADGAVVVGQGVVFGHAKPGGATEAELDAFHVAGHDGVCRGRVRVRLPPRTDPPPVGAKVVLEGRWWTTPRTSAWPAPPERRGTLAVHRITESSALPSGIVALRGRAQVRIRALFGEHAGLVEAMLLARREALDTELRDRFAKAGLSHLLAISGAHVGLIAAAVLLVAKVARLSARTAALVAGIVTAAYVLMLGAPHAAARAALQMLLLLFARMMQRPSDPMTLMAAAAMVLVAVRPNAILDPGFQLSFAGVFGLLAFQKPIRATLPRRLPEGLASTLSATVAATLTTLPIAALHFGLAAPIGLVTNLVAVPMLAAAVPAAAVALFADAINASLGAFLAGGASVPFAWLAGTASVAARAPGGHAYWGAHTVWVSLLAAALFVLVRSHMTRGRPASPRAVAIALAAAVSFASLPIPALRGQLEIHVIDVGQGDAIAVRTPLGRWLLVDAGPRSPTWDAGRARVVPYLFERGAREIEVFVLTHPDMDHIGGAPAVIRALEVRNLVDPAWPAAKHGFLEMLDLAGTIGVPWFAARAGREITLDGVTLSILAPDGTLLDGPAGSNDYSVVFRLDWGRFGALFTGDAPRSVENALVAQHDRDLAVDLLKVGHHGSRTSTGDSLLSAARPRLAVVSVGQRNRYGHPDSGVVRRLARHRVPTLRTDQSGTIIVRVRPDGTLTFTTER